MNVTIELTTKDNTVGSLLTAILDAYVKASEENGLPVHRVIVNDCLMYWDSEKVLKEWEENGSD